MSKATSKKEKGLLSTSALARETGLNRATVRERLQHHQVEAKEEKAKEKLYDADEALAALQGDDRTGLRKAQTMKVAAEAARTRIKLDRERGDVVPIQDVRADVQEVVKRIYQQFAVTGPGTLAPQLRGKNVSQIEAALRRNAEQFFNELRAEYESYL